MSFENLFELVASSESDVELTNLFKQQIKQDYNANVVEYYMQIPKNSFWLNFLISRLNYGSRAPRSLHGGVMRFAKRQLLQAVRDCDVLQDEDFHLLLIASLASDKIKQAVRMALFNDFCNQLLTGLKVSNQAFYCSRYMMLIDLYSNNEVVGCDARQLQIFKNIKAVYRQCYQIMRGDITKIKPLIESGLKLPLQSESHVFKLLMSHLIKNIRSYHRLTGHFHPTLLVDIFREIHLRRSLFKYSCREPFYFVEQARLDAFKIVTDSQNALECQRGLESRISCLVECFHHLIFNSRLITLYINNFIAYGIHALSIKFEDDIKFRSDLSEILDSKKQTAFFVLLQREFFKLLGQSTGFPTLQPHLYACSSRFFDSFSSIHDQLLRSKFLFQITPALDKCDFLHYRVPEQFETIILFDDKCKDIKENYRQFCVDEATDDNAIELPGAFCKLSMNGRTYFILDPQIVKGEEFHRFKEALELLKTFFIAFDIDGTLNPCYGREEQFRLRCITPGPMGFSTVVDLCSMAQGYMILTNGAMERPRLKHYSIEVSQAVRKQPAVDLSAQSRSCSP